MEWVILVIGILGVGAVFSKVMDVSGNTTIQQSKHQAESVASLNQAETGRDNYYSDVEEGARLEERIWREQMEEDQRLHDEQQRLFQEQVNEQNRLFDEQSNSMTDPIHDVSDDSQHSFSDPYRDVGTDMNTDINYHGVVDDPLDMVDEYPDDDYLDAPIDTWHDTGYDDHY